MNLFVHPLCMVVVTKLVHRECAELQWNCKTKKSIWKTYPSLWKDSPKSFTCGIQELSNFGPRVKSSMRITLVWAVCSLVSVKLHIKNILLTDVCIAPLHLSFNFFLSLYSLPKDLMELVTHINVAKILVSLAVSIFVQLFRECSLLSVADILIIYILSVTWIKQGSKQQWDQMV